MALNSKSIITYGISIDSMFSSLDFKADSGGPEITATIAIGNYSPTGLAIAVAAAMNAVDPANNYSCTVIWGQIDGTQNRLVIATTGTFLSILFSSGTNVATSISTLIGFLPQDYTGLTSYTGASSVGTVLVPDFIGYNYLDDFNQSKVFGAVNISASGLKEAVVFNFQKFIDVEFKYEAKARLPQWKLFFLWAIQQNAFDFTPQIFSPSKVYQVTLEKTVYDGKGLGFQMKEMLPDFPNFFMTGPLNFRIVES